MQGFSAGCHHYATTASRAALVAGDRRHEASGIVARVGITSDPAARYVIYFFVEVGGSITAPAWDAGNGSWTRGWWVPSHTSWYSHGRAKFTLNVGGNHIQTANPDVCIHMGNHGGSAWS